MAHELDRPLVFRGQASAERFGELHRRRADEVPRSRIVQESLEGARPRELEPVDVESMAREGQELVDRMRHLALVAEESQAGILHARPELLARETGRLQSVAEDDRAAVERNGGRVFPPGMDRGDLSVARPHRYGRPAGHGAGTS